MTSAETLFVLSRKELEGRVVEQERQIAELQGKVDELTNPPPNDWHSWFYILLNLALYKFRKDNVKILREVVLGAMPPRADFVVVEEGDIIDLELDVFRFFRRFNILEFKSPDDELSESILWKAVGYAGFFISCYKANPKDITLTLFRGARPVKLLEGLGECVKTNGGRGIYSIEGWRVDFPIQIVVTTELEGKEYAAFRTISKRPALDDIKAVMEKAESETDPEARILLREFLEMLSKLDGEVIEEVKARHPKMARTWRDIFEIDKEIDAAVSNDRRTNLYTYVQDGDMALERAARRAGMSMTDFANCMRDAGYRIPQGELV